MVTIQDYKISPIKKIVDNLDIQVIYIPLEIPSGYKYKPVVSAGDYVCIGSIIGKSAVIDVPLISSVSGTVVGFQEKYISNDKLVNCIVIENDFKEKYNDRVGKVKDITKYSQEEFVYLLKRYGIFNMSMNCVPTYTNYEANKKINCLIVNGLECEIYSSADNAVMYNYPEEILETIDAMMEIMKIDKAYIAINEKNEIIIKKFLKYINTYPNIKVYPILDGYPNGYNKYLIKTIIGSNSKCVTVVENVSTIYAIYEALKYHKPLAERIVTISGNKIKKSANYKLKIGTNFSEVAMKANLYNNQSPSLLIAGGAMMGTAIANDELIVTPELNTILIMDDVDDQVVSCIKCGKCAEVCPMNLIPSLIIDTHKKVNDLKIDKCIECGLCSYVCPSKIEVREIIKKIKEEHK